jgi:hypothetical protein
VSNGLIDFHESVLRASDPTPSSIMHSMQTPAQTQLAQAQLAQAQLVQAQIAQTQLAQTQLAQAHLAQLAPTTQFVSTYAPMNPGIIAGPPSYFTIAGQNYVPAPSSVVETAKPLAQESPKPSATPESINDEYERRVDAKIREFRDISRRPTAMSRRMEDEYETRRDHPDLGREVRNLNSAMRSCLDGNRAPVRRG